MTPLQQMRFDEVGHREEEAWNELPVSVTQALFDSMSNQIRTLLTASGFICFYYICTTVNPETAD